MRVTVDRLISTRTAAGLIEVSPRTVARWIREGKLDAVKIGRVWRVRESEVMKLGQLQPEQDQAV